MSYEVLARKYRPKTFEEVFGQQTIVQTLQGALRSGTAASAYMFVGGHGLGKTTVARILAKTFCCKNRIDNPCNNCFSCNEIDDGIAPDFVERDCADITKKDSLLEIIEDSYFAPQVLPYKVVILDEVHMMSLHARQATLKTIEEPPSYMKFIFATTDKNRIETAIRSRCQVFNFKPMSRTSISSKLKEISSLEGFSIDERGLDLIARESRGAMRDALSLTDQVISFAGKNATSRDVAEALGVVEHHMIVSLVKAITKKDAKAAIDVVDLVYSSGFQMDNMIDSLIFEFRNIAITKSTGKLEKYEDIPPELVVEIDEISRNVSSAEVHTVYNMAMDFVSRSENRDYTKQMVDTLIIKMCDRPTVGDPYQINRAITELSRLAQNKEVKRG